MGVLEGLEAVGLAQGLHWASSGQGWSPSRSAAQVPATLEWSASTRSCVTVYVVSTRVAVARTTVA